MFRATSRCEGFSWCGISYERAFMFCLKNQEHPFTLTEGVEKLSKNGYNGQTCWIEYKHKMSSWDEMHWHSRHVGCKHRLLGSCHKRKLHRYFLSVCQCCWELWISVLLSQSLSVAHHHGEADMTYTVYYIWLLTRVSFFLCLAQWWNRTHKSK